VPAVPSWPRVAARAAADWPPDRLVLSEPHRLTSGRHFGQAIRTGGRAGTRTLVLHLAVTDAPAAPARIGFVVSKAVGNAVARNLVKRRLRHLARERVSSLPDSALLVVRALPAASGATFCELSADFDSAFTRALARSAAAGVPA
jgi:ribonuclease P protein component